MKNLIVAVCASFLMLPVCAQTSDAEQIKKINADWLSAYPNKDSITLNKLLADDFKLVTDRGKELDKQTFINVIIHSSGSISFQTDTTEIRLFDNSAILIGYGTSTSNHDNQSDKGKNRYTSFFVKRNGAWQAVGTSIVLMRDDN